MVMMSSPEGVHAKNSRVRFDRKRGHKGRTHFWVKPTRNPGQTEPESDSERHFKLRFRVSLTWILGRFDPKMGLAPWDPFSGSNLTREFLECRQ